MNSEEADIIETQQVSSLKKQKTCAKPSTKFSEIDANVFYKDTVSSYMRV